MWLLSRSEAASIDKMMHVLDYDRALGELLELDDTIKATIARTLPSSIATFACVLTSWLSFRLERDWRIRRHSHRGHS